MAEPIAWARMRGDRVLAVFLRGEERKWQEILDRRSDLREVYAIKPLVFADTFDSARLQHLVALGLQREAEHAGTPLADGLAVVAAQRFLAGEG